jgi:hypothetical protein
MKDERLFIKKRLFVINRHHRHRCMSRPRKHFDNGEAIALAIA